MLAAVFRMRFLPAVGYALFTLCGSALLSSITVFWTSASLPARRRSSVLDRASGFLSPASSSLVVFAPRVRLRVVWWSPSTTHSPARAARVESVVFSRSCNATLLSRALLLRSSWHSMSRPPWHSMALRRRFTRALVSDKLFARPRADPRALFFTILLSSAALARPLQPLCVEVILLPANTRHPALVISLSTDATVLRVFRLGLRVAIPPKLCCDSPQLSPLRLATCLMVSGHFSTQTCLC